MARRTTRFCRDFTIALAMALALPAARAGEQHTLTLDTYETALLEASGHPNELNRWHGLWAYQNGHIDQAREFFERAAMYADKLSQHALTLMYWNGDEGAPRDPVLAYVWADLAAERGTSQDLLRLRERIWDELTPQQRQQVGEIGPGYHARYGDAVAQERMNAELRRFMRNQTGSRVGALTSKLDISLGRPELGPRGVWSGFGQIRTTGTEFYAARRTEPAAYWKAEDKHLRALIGARVEVGKVRKASSDRDDGRDGH
ncbi:MAG TPA: hypothetical protein VIT66_04325 [Lysobacter sp.]